jgi:hypothetical protein
MAAAEKSEKNAKQRGSDDKSVPVSVWARRLSFVRVWDGTD